MLGDATVPVTEPLSMSAHSLLCGRWLSETEARLKIMTPEVRVEFAII